VVEEDVRTVTDLFLALVGAVAGYVFGVLRTLNERRNERRDAALAEISKEMELYYRYLGSWIGDIGPDPDETSAESDSLGIPARKHVNDQYKKFLLVFHGNAIWLGKDTYDLIQEFSIASRDFLNELTHMTKRAGVWRLPDGTDPKDRRKARIIPKFEKVRDALRAEVEASRGLISQLRYQIVNRKKRRGD
jgi:hypothetical protein